MLREQFTDDLNYYESARFDETRARQRFIDPFFAALGWLGSMVTLDRDRSVKVELKPDVRKAGARAGRDDQA